jgi:hypothetical protein
MTPRDPRLLGLGLVLSLLFGGVIAWGRVKPVKVPRVGSWEDVPVVCAGRGVDPAALDQAAVWWDSQGHELELSCERWTVSIDIDATLDTRASVDDVALTHGVTVLHTDQAVVVAAEIRVLPGADALVIAHELGHALGLLHPRFAPSGHILHPSRPGWDGRGVQP